MKSFHPDILFVELQLKGLDGLEFLDMVRSAPDIANNDIPFFIISGYAEKKNVIAAAQKGADAFLVKPLRPVDLMTRLKVILSGHRPSYERWLKTRKQFGKHSEYIEL